MLGYYPNSNAKARGSNLNEKIQTLISLTFHKHLCWLAYIYTSNIQINIKHTQTQKTHIHTYKHLLTSKHTYINTCIHTYIYTYKHIHTYIHIYIYIYIYYIYIYIYIYNLYIIYIHKQKHIYTCINIYIYIDIHT